MPFAAVAVAARVAAGVGLARAECGGRERLQRMTQHQVGACRFGIEVIAGGDVDQFADQQRGLAPAAVARIGPEVADMEHVARGGEQLQEQEAVVVAQRAVAAAARGGA